MYIDTVLYCEVLSVKRERERDEMCHYKVIDVCVGIMDSLGVTTTTVIITLYEVWW